MKYVPKLAAYSINELARMYGVSFRTMRKILRQLNLWQRNKKKYFPNEIEKVFSKLGIPEIHEEDVYYFAGKVIRIE